MSGRRLPLFSTAERPAALVSAVRQALPGRALIVADTGADVAALTWARRFVEALGRSGRQAPVVLSALPGAPEAAARFAGLSGARSVRVLGAEERAAPHPALNTGDLWVLVGQPALLSAHAWLSVLLEADAPVLRWPLPLRALRGKVSLELSGAGLEVAGALARALAE